jgi:hypothetical protein
MLTMAAMPMAANTKVSTYRSQVRSRLIPQAKAYPIGPGFSQIKVATGTRACLACAIGGWANVAKLQHKTKMRSCGPLSHFPLSPGVKPNAVGYRFCLLAGQLEVAGRGRPISGNGAAPQRANQAIAAGGVQSIDREDIGR